MFVGLVVILAQVYQKLLLWFVSEGLYNENKTFCNLMLDWMECYDTIPLLYSFGY
jgi:hypothetical protein